MTIEAHEVTTVDELQHLILLGGGDGEHLHELCSCEATTGAHGVTTTGPHVRLVQPKRPLKLMIFISNQSFEVCWVLPTQSVL